MLNQPCDYWFLSPSCFCWFSSLAGFQNWNTSQGRNSFSWQWQPNLTKNSPADKGYMLHPAGMGNPGGLQVRRLTPSCQGTSWCHVGSPWTCWWKSKWTQEDGLRPGTGAGYWQLCYCRYHPSLFFSLRSSLPGILLIPSQSASLPPPWADLPAQGLLTGWWCVAVAACLWWQQPSCTKCRGAFYNSCKETSAAERVVLAVWCGQIGVAR